MLTMIQYLFWPVFSFNLFKEGSHLLSHSNYIPSFFKAQDTVYRSDRMLVYTRVWKDLKRGIRVAKQSRSTLQMVILKTNIGVSRKALSLGVQHTAYLFYIFPCTPTYTSLFFACSQGNRETGYHQESSRRLSPYSVIRLNLHWWTDSGL